MGVAEEELKKELDELQDELDELNDQYLRALADFDNYKKRVEKERAKNRDLGRQEVIVRILDVLDNFERAFDATDDEDDDPVTSGFRAIYQELLEVLEGFGVAPFDAIGEIFDPIFHDAISTHPTSDHPSNTIMREFQRGYLIGKDVLRPAKVEVAREP
jgi:molecular chaperone GrpE